MGMKTPELNGAKRFLRGSADDQVVKKNCVLSGQ